MSLRYTTRILVGAATLIAFGATLAFAQDTTSKKKSTTKKAPSRASTSKSATTAKSTTTRTRRASSTQRIPITKEGEVATRVDTITVYRTDTLRTPATYIHDTVSVTRVRVDTVTMTVAPPVPPIIMPHGFYFGIAGGGTSPNGALFQPQNTGPSGQVQLGWQGAKQVLGLRADANFARLQTDAGFPNPNHPQFWNFSADAKLQLPFMTHMLGTRHRFSVYGIGGYTYTMFRNTILRLDTPDGAPAVYSLPSTDWTKESGWNAGGGASLYWGHSEIFVESRVMGFKASGAVMARQIPVMLGYNFY